MCGPLLKAIGRFGSRRKFAIKLGVSPERLNAWLNRGVNIPKHYAEMIEQLCEGEVTWQELAPHLVHFKQRTLMDSGDSLLCEAINLSLSRIQHSYLPPEINEKVNALLEDIKQHGLQKPICVDAQNQLIFGKKRLRAYELLDKKTIPAWRLSLKDLIFGKYSAEQLTKIFQLVNVLLSV